MTVLSLSPDCVYERETARVLWSSGLVYPSALQPHEITLFSEVLSEVAWLFTACVHVSVVLTLHLTRVSEWRKAQSPVRVTAPSRNQSTRSAAVKVELAAIKQGTDGVLLPSAGYD
ncbi:unnamed protein product [Pleuronectes platessa]|uniref:Uncharacterized protein n=1 Tax=Pleuronectes platessa TaxID=8262 RepID=A0A9N7YF52_PLEPL|nr:unnamed protein product [Pleuronectes platessa]